MLCLNVKAEASILTFDYAKEVTYNINYLYDTKEGYLFTVNNIVYSSNNNSIIAQKEFNNLTNIKIIAFNDQYLLVGIDNTSLKVYLIDNYLQISSSKEIPITDFTNLNLYSYKDKIYVLDLTNGVLNSPKIYEIDKDLNIIEENFSSYSSEDLKEILKSDYYLIHQNDDMTYYNASTYTENNNILVGYKINENSQEEAIIKILSSDGEEVTKISNPLFTRFYDIEVINNTIVTLTKDFNNSYLYFYDLEGNYLDRISINDNPYIEKINRIDNQIYLINNNIVTVYKYDCLINTEEQVYGAINVSKIATPNEPVTVDVIPNSGYKVANITVKDTKGNIIPINDNSFIMPTDDVNIKVEYTASVVNPETVDTILTVLISFIVIGIISYNIYRKFSWLRK